MKKLIFALCLTALLLIAGCAEEQETEPCAAGCATLGYDIGQCVRASEELSCESMGGTQILAGGEPVENCSFRSDTAWDECCCLKENQETPDNEQDCIGNECNETPTEIVLIHSCDSNKDCGWVSTNCCTENAGAEWQCVNKAESIIECRENTVCPEVLSPAPETKCSCVENVCTEIKKKPVLLSPPCDLVTESNQLSFNWTPVNSTVHSVQIYRIGAPETEFEANHTEPGFLGLKEPLGDGEYYWTISEGEDNVSEKCAFTVLRQEITCSDLQLKLTECWQKFNEIEAGETAFCGEIIGYENNCLPEELAAFIEEDERFAIDLYDTCNKIEFFYDKTDNLEPEEEHFNKAHAMCSEGMKQ